MSATEDAAFMRRALDLARRGRGMTHPNPLVGAVVVRNGRIIGEGWHETYGGPHAEVLALRDAGAEAHGADLYVTLEPCAHHGKTPPCVDAIHAAGIARVVYAADDPHAAAAGGAARLRQHGIAVEAGIERGAARAQNRQFFHLHERDTAWVTLKLAQSLDGGIAAAPGERTRITGPEAAAETHRLRADHQAVLVGSRTALVDDPLLTVRDVPCRVPPVRIVLDAAARLPPQARLLATLDQAPLWIVCRADADAGRVRALEQAGARVLRARPAPAGLDPASLLETLGAAGVRSVLVEGGGAVARGWLAAGVVQRIQLFVAPILLGDTAVPGLAGAPAGQWQLVGVDRFGADVLLTLDPATAPVEST